ncbi:hypothetical protein Hanom_Chr07g00620011 [Helianthus anomalus]
MATSPHSNPEVAGSSLARSRCPYGSGFTPRLRLAGWRSARWDHLGGWEDRGNYPPPPPPALVFTLVLHLINAIAIISLLVSLINKLYTCFILYMLHYRIFYT